MPGLLHFLPPPHLLPEVTNALHQRTRRATKFALDSQEADEALETIINLRITILDDPDLYPNAEALVRRYNLARAYDAIYVALAEMPGAQF